MEGYKPQDFSFFHRGGKISTTCITVMGQVWFYIPSGEDPETYNSPDVQAVYIIIKDTNGDLWFLYSKTKTVIENLLDNINFYADAFNNGTHQKSDYNPQIRNL